MATEIKRPLCHMSHSRCGLLATVEDGTITKLEGDPNCIVNQGRICERPREGGLEFHYHPDRVNYPMKRVGARGSGKWERISWDQANTEIAAKMKELIEEYGPETVVLERGTGRHEEWYQALFFNCLDSPHCATGPSDICYCPTSTTDSVTYGQFAGTFAGPKSRCFVYWGHNSAESGDYTDYWGTEELMRRGNPKLIVVDPRCTEYAAKADIWLQLRPGTDGAMAMGWLNVIIEEKLYDKEFVAKWCHGFDELTEAAREYTPEKVAEITWVPAYKIREAARMYAANSPSVFPWGLATDCLGRNATQANRAKALIRAITGSMNIEGGTYLVPPHTLKFRTSNDLGHPELLSQRAKDRQLGADRFKLHAWPGYELQSAAQKRVYKKDYAGLQNYGACTPSTVSFAAALTGKPYPAKCWFIQAGNPFSNVSNTKYMYEAMKQTELLVTHEYFNTPMAMMSDYVLPAADWLERPMHNPFVVWGPITDIDWWGERAVQPEHERRDNYTFWRGLAEKCFSKDVYEKYWPWENKEEAALYIMEPAGYKTFEECVEKPYIPPVVPEWHKDIDPETGSPYGFATPTGKVECSSTIIEKLYSPEYAVPYYEEPFESLVSTPDIAEEYPLILTAGSRFMPYYHSEHRQLKSFRERYRDPHFQIHPSTAAELGIGDGDWCWIETKRGRCVQRAKLDSGLDQRVIAAQHGWWFPELPAEEPWMGGWFMSNINMCTDMAPENCCELSGGYNMKLALCKVTKSAPAPFDTFIGS